MKLELYFAPGACSFVAHAALETIKAAAGHDFEPHLIKLHKGEQRTDEFLKLNPNGQVPVLVVDGKPLTQIVAICDFLDRSFPQAKLLPTDAFTRAQAMSAFAWMNNSAHPTFTHFFMPAKFTSDETAQAAIKSQAAGDFQGHIKRIEKMMSEHSQLFNASNPGILGAYVLTLLRWSGFVGLNPADVPKVTAFVHAAAKSPAFSAAMERERINLDTFKAA